MATSDQSFVVTLPAGADLSTKQYQGVVVAADGNVDPVAGDGADCDGVLLNDPAAAGRPCEVATHGITKAKAGVGGITRGDKAQCLATGLFTTAASGDHVIGKALTTAAANGIFSMLMVSKHILA